MTDGMLKGGRAILLLSGLVYPFAAVAILALAVRSDPFSIFQPGYWLAFFVVLPVIWAFVTVQWARRFGSVAKGWFVAHLGLVGLFTFAHFWVMAQFAAGV